MMQPETPSVSASACRIVAPSHGTKGGTKMEDVFSQKSKKEEDGGRDSLTGAPMLIQIAKN
jgi:hypothetical protein